MAKNILITGASSQIAFYLKNLFGAAGHSVDTTHYNKQIENSIYMDLMSEDSIKRVVSRGYDVVINAASFSSVSESFEDPKKCQAINYGGFLDISKHALKINQDVLLVQVGSCEIWGHGSIARFHCPDIKDMENKNFLDYGGMCYDVLVQNFSAPFKPWSPYGISKLAAYEWANHLRRSGAKTINVVAFNHESKYRRGGFLFKKLISNIKHGHEFLIGNVDVARDWSHAYDVALTVIEAMMRGPGNYIAGSGNSFTIKGLINKIEDVLSKRACYTINEGLIRKGEPSIYMADKDSLIHKPTISLEEIINEVAANC